MQDRESVTINPEVNKAIKEQAKKEVRSYSNMLQVMAEKYLETIKKK